MVLLAVWCDRKLNVEDRTLTYNVFFFTNCDFEGELLHWHSYHIFLSLNQYSVGACWVARFIYCFKAAEPCVKPMTCQYYSVRITARRIHVNVIFVEFTWICYNQRADCSEGYDCRCFIDTCTCIHVAG